MLGKKQHLGHQASSVRSAKSSPAVFTSSWTEGKLTKLAFKAARITQIQCVSVAYLSLGIS